MQLNMISFVHFILAWNLYKVEWLVDIMLYSVWVVTYSVDIYIESVLRSTEYIYCLATTPGNMNTTTTIARMYFKIETKHNRIFQLQPRVSPAVYSAECGIITVIDKRDPNFQAPPASQPTSARSITIFNYSTFIQTYQFVQSGSHWIEAIKMSGAPSSCKVVLSKHIANGLLAEVREGVRTLEKAPHLVGFLANSDPAAVMYAQMTEKTCQEKWIPPLYH